MGQPSRSRAAPLLLLRLLTGLASAWAGWLLMMAVHESGHVFMAVVTGGQIDHVQLSPIGLSQTHLAHNPRPLLVVWAGPVLGVAIPLVMWLLTRRWDKDLPRNPLEWPMAFFAGLCLIANGVYLGLGWIDRVGDTGDMMRLGTPTGALIGFGVVTVLAGLWIWHSLGPWMGLGRMTDKQALLFLLFSVGVILAGFALMPDKAAALN